MLNSIQRQREAKNAAAAYFRGASPSAAVRDATELIPENILGWGIGNKTVNEKTLDTVRIYVRELPDSTIPENFGQLPTDVIEVGKITTYQNPLDRHRPVPCGVSVGHPNITAGTLGCLVEKNGNHYILSNNHVLADSNAAAVGDPVIQPGSSDDGLSPQDNIATLEPYREIDFSGAYNAIDAAIAWVGDCNQAIVVPEIIGIGIPRSNPMPAALDQIVSKEGRTTGWTTSTVTDISADIRVHFGSQEAWFEDQIAIKSVEHDPFSHSGDSGSLIVDTDTLRPVALLFAGSDLGDTFANPIDVVLQHYGVTVVGEYGEDR